ncbi:MFS transporter [Flaviaesturariibacter amylovorans]|uniref:MFS transporter n=1 Tax=Flaviaesturariibacter amylovorans TaxID=1084520 RepID=A0ABP8H1I1_9BACT
MIPTPATQSAAPAPASRGKLAGIIAASSVGTLIEWYDFYIFGSLAQVISTKFFPSGNATVALLSTLATFAAGFVVRPFGALVFGRLGDMVGRKHTFLLTLVLMGLSTFLIGCVPGYETIGVAAPILVLVLRLLQGLALGGEYGGAATYVAEHAPAHRRGFWTSWIQTTATAGLFVSLGVIVTVKSLLDADAFNEWGWRIPFWISILMVALSIVIRMRMHESPLFAKAKAEGKVSVNPLKESFGNRYNFKFVLLALFGATMGQGVVWYTGQFYALSFIQTTLSIEVGQASRLIMWALVFATPFFVFFGWLSDRIGRKWIMLAGMGLAVLCYRPIYSAMYSAGSLDGRVQVDYPGAAAPGVLPAAVMEADRSSPGDSLRTVRFTRRYVDGTQAAITTVYALRNGQQKELHATKAVILDEGSFWKLVGLVFLQVLFVTMVYGPIAAFLVELFPTRIRYTSMSLPYHIGNGIFGGLMPTVALFLSTKAVAANEAAQKAGTALPYEQPYLEGLWYPILLAAVSFVVGALYLSGKDRRVDD